MRKEPLWDPAEPQHDLLLSNGGRGAKPASHYSLGMGDQ